MVNGVGLVGLACRQLNVGYELAGQGVTLRMDGTQMAVISHGGGLLRTLPCPSRHAVGAGSAAHAAQPACPRSPPDP